MQNTHRMKFLIIILLGVFVFAGVSKAHTKRESFAKINGEEASLTNSANLSVEDWSKLVHDTDFAGRTYSANEKLNFELIRDRIRVIPEYIDSSNYVWDFGDGTPVQTIKGGLSTSHSYKKPGGYVIIVNIIYSPAVPYLPDPIYLESIFVEITETSKTTAPKSSAPSKPKVTPQPIPAEPEVLPTPTVGAFQTASELQQQPRAKGSSSKSIIWMTLTLVLTAGVGGIMYKDGHR